MTITIVSFVLTGVIGACISYVIQKRSAENDREAAHYQSSTTAIASFSDSIYKRFTRAGLLKSALKRCADKSEVLERKRLYDEAVVSQESELFGRELLIREALEQSQYSKFEDLYAKRLRPRLHELDGLLTSATDQYVVHPAALIDQQPIQDAYDKTRSCSYDLVNLIFLEVSSKQYRGKSGQPVQTHEEAVDDFDSDCPERKSDENVQ